MLRTVIGLRETDDGNGDGVTRVTVTEAGGVYNAVFPFIGHFFWMGRRPSNRT